MSYFQRLASENLKKFVEKANPYRDERGRFASAEDDVSGANTGSVIPEEDAKYQEKLDYLERHGTREEKVLAKEARIKSKRDEFRSKAKATTGQQAKDAKLVSQAYNDWYGNHADRAMKNLAEGLEAKYKKVWG